ncbi:MAG: AraC family transcriptional regulator, partial [Pseudomonadota bacterium]
AELIATHLLTSLLIELDAPRLSPARLPKGRAAKVLDLAERIVEDPTADSGIATLARDAACSPDHFTRLFRDLLGCAPQEFVIQAKIARACALLVETNLTVSEVALSLNYSSPYFFARQFKQRIGCAPSSYRRSRASSA